MQVEVGGGADSRGVMAQLALTCYFLTFKIKVAWGKTLANGDWASIFANQNMDSHSERHFTMNVGKIV